jgi:hypothetical protein
MNVEIGTTEAPLFLFWEYFFRIFGIVSLQCGRGPQFNFTFTLVGLLTETAIFILT